MKRLILLAMASLIAGTAHAQDVLRMGTEGAYAPFNYVGADGKVAGFDVDIGNALCEKMNRSCEWTTQDWQGIIPALQGGKFDVLMSSMTITEARRQQIDFTADANLEISPEGLKGKMLGAVRETVNAIYVDAKFADVATIQTYVSSDDLFLDLKNGRLDAAFGDATELSPWLKDHGGDEFVQIGETVSDPLLGEGIGIGVRKGDSTLLADLNKALDAIVADGTFATLSQKYFDFPLR
jgi:lysine-arginine-ornithine-binding protein